MYRERCAGRAFRAASEDMVGREVAMRTLSGACQDGI
jgi:hypothetical protein